MTCGLSASYPAPDETDDAAREGTCAAWVGETVINGDAHSCLDMLGKTHENGWVVDGDMVKHVQDYVDLMAKRPQGKAEVFMQHPTLPLAGTADHIGWSMDMTTLYITDLKYGYKIVSVDTWQLIAYLFLVLSLIPPDRWPRLIQLAIYQPRATHKDGPYRKKVVSIAEIQPKLDEMQTQITHIIQQRVNAVPGSHCMHCHLAASCTALTRTVYDIWQVVQSRDFIDPTPEQLSTELTMLQQMSDMFEARKTAVEAEAEARIMGAGFVPGWHVETKYGKRKFTVDDAMIRMMTGIDPTVTKTCTPAELIRRGAKEDVVKSITIKPRIGAKLTRVDEDDVAKHFAKAQKGVPHG